MSPTPPTGTAPPNTTRWVGRVALWALTGAVVGLVLGLVLKAVGVVQNPFWLMSAALVTGAALAVGQAASRAERRPPDDDV